MRGYRGFTLIFCLLHFFALHSQGIFKEFGQNRIQFRTFEWKQLNSNNIDILFYDNQDILANQAMKIAQTELQRLETFLSYKYGGSMQIVVFSSLLDYRQSNIGYENPQLNSGGYMVVPNDLNSVYFNGSYADLKQQLRKAICEIMMREMIYGGTLQDRFDRVRAPALPIWFTEGLSAFLSESWSAQRENELIDAFSTNTFASFNTLNRDQQVLAGHSIWRYLVETYGAETVSTLVFISRYTHSAEAAIYFQTQKPISAFLKDWKAFYNKSLTPSANQNIPKGTANIPPRISKKRFTDFSIDPDGNQVAIVTNDHGRFNIWLYGLNDASIKHIYSGGHKVVNQHQALEFPHVKWHPIKNTLHFITYEKGNFSLIELAGNKLKTAISFNQFQTVTSFDYSGTGDSLIFSAVLNGKSDLYLLNLKTNIYTQLTNDLFTDKEPVFTKSGKIIFISNRTSTQTDEHFENETDNIFIVNGSKIEGVTGFTSKTNISSLIAYGNGITGFLMDQSGLSNAYAVSIDSGTLAGQTNYRVGIQAQCIAKGGATLGELLLLNGRYQIFTSQVGENPLSDIVLPTQRSWINYIGNLDSLFAERNVMVTVKNYLGPDSTYIEIIDTTHRSYIFQSGFERTENAAENAIDTNRNYNFKKVNFRNSLQPDFVISQSDNRILGSYLQNGQIRKEALRNQVIMPYFKIALSDLLKNYLVESSFRTSLDLLITDYSLRCAFYKHRIDHDFSVSRHSRKYEDGNLVLKQNLSTQFRYTLTYPFSEKSRVNLHTGLRRELNFIKGSEAINLTAPASDRYYTTNGIDYQFDNTTSLGLNMFSGIRFSGGFESLKMLNSGAAVSYLFGDLRYSKPLYRKILLAFRMAGAYNLGKEKIMYYLGAVENWTTKIQFEQNLPQTDASYLFQQWVCNLRGFSRGVRMGSSYLLTNTEIRIPLVQTFLKAPVESEFLKNFTLTFFSDIGTAFTGKSPADPANPFNTIYYSTPNYDLSVTSKRNPFVMGVGYGLRTRLLGYFVKFDRGWGLKEKQWLKPVNYFSIGFDF